MKDVSNEIVALFKGNGYTPEETIRELTIILSCDILAKDENYVHVENDRIKTIVSVIEKE